MTFLVCLAATGQRLSAQRIAPASPPVALAVAVNEDTRLAAGQAGRLAKARLGQSYAVGDFNRDGVDDVAAADFLADSLAISFGAAGGGFEPPVTLRTGRGPRALVAADLDNDGVVDLAVGEFLSGSVRVFAGLGGGRFTAGDTTTLEPGISSLAAHDSDGDGRVDIAVANVLSGSIDLLQNTGRAPFSAARIARVPTPTLLLWEGRGRDGGGGLVAIDANGQRTQVLGDATDAPQRGASLSAARLKVVGGDGLVQPVGGAAREPLVVEVSDPAGDPSAGELVWFSRVLGGAEILEPMPAGSPAADMRATNGEGRAFVDLLLPRLPDASVTAASVVGGRVETLGVISVMKTEELARLVAAASTAEATAGVAAATTARLQGTVRRLDGGDVHGALGDLVAVIDQLRMAAPGATHPNAAGAAERLTRRWLAQILLLGGSPKAVDNEPITCDVPLSRTIAVATEVDSFSFSGAAAELLHITIGNEGGTGPFDPQWRLLGPDASPVAGCDTFSGADRACTLPVAGAYAIEVEDGGFNATGNYSLQIQRLTAAERCGTAIACDVPAATSITPRADTDLHQFTGVAADVVHITIGIVGGTGPFDPQWRLVAPDASMVAGCDTFSASTRECTLPSTGAYAIEVGDGGFNATGTYTVTQASLSGCIVAPRDRGVPGRLVGALADAPVGVVVGAASAPLCTSAQ